MCIARKIKQRKIVAFQHKLERRRTMPRGHIIRAIRHMEAEDIAAKRLRPLNEFGDDEEVAGEAHLPHDRESCPRSQPGPLPGAPAASCEAVAGTGG